MSNAPPPDSHPIIYVACVLAVLHALVMSYLGSLVHVRHSQLIEEIEKLAKLIEAEGKALRKLLALQEQRKLRRRAREAELRIEFGDEADEQIAVSRIIDATQDDGE